MTLMLSTQRLILRRPHPTDAPRLTRLLDNFAVAGNLAQVPYPYRLADAQAWLRRWQADQPSPVTGFAIDLPGEGLIGHVDFREDEAAAVLGYWLGQPFWNRGLMSEAARAALDWYFGTTNAEVVTSGAFHFNRASLAVQRKLGFREVGTSTCLCLARGEQVRHIDTELTRTAWAEKRAA